MNFNYNSTKSIKFVNKYFIIILIIAFIIQFIIDYEPANIICSLIILICSLSTFKLVLKSHLVQAFPLPVVMVLGYNIATLSGALLVQSLYFVPVTYNLKTPVFTFFCATIYQFSLILAFKIFIKLVNFKKIELIQHNIVDSLLLLQKPHAAQLWVMGGIGCLYNAYIAFISNNISVSYGDVFGKLLDGFNFFVLAPYLIPLTRYLWQSFNGDKEDKSILLKLSIYTAVLIILSIAKNTRGLFASGITNFGVILFIEPTVILSGS